MSWREDTHSTDVTMPPSSCIDIRHLIKKTINSENVKNPRNIGIAYTTNKSTNNDGYSKFT